MDTDAIVAQLADNDQADRAAFRAANYDLTMTARHAPRHASSEVHFLGHDVEGLAVYANGKSVL